MQLGENVGAHEAGEAASGPPPLTAMEARRWRWLRRPTLLLTALLVLAVLARELSGPVTVADLPCLGDWPAQFATLWASLLGTLWLRLQALAFRRERQGELLEILGLLPDDARDWPAQKQRSHLHLLAWWAWPGLLATIWALACALPHATWTWHHLPALGRLGWWLVCAWALGQIALDLGLRRPRLTPWVLAIGLLAAWALERTLPIVISLLMTLQPLSPELRWARLGNLLLALGCLLVWLAGPCLLGHRATLRTRRHLTRLANQSEG